MYKRSVLSILRMLILINVYCAKTGALINTNIALHENENENKIRATKHFPKLVSFDILEDQIEVSAHFIIPFVSVPKRRLYDPASIIKEGFVSINVASLFLAGGLIGGGALIGSLFTKISRSAWDDKLLPPLVGPYKEMKFVYTAPDGSQAEAELFDLIDGFEDFLRKQNIDVTSCVQKAVCTIVNTSANAVDRGGFSKLVDGITSSSRILDYMHGTAVRDAIEMGRENVACEAKFRECPWPEAQIKEFLVDILDKM